MVKKSLLTKEGSIGGRGMGWAFRGREGEALPARLIVENSINPWSIACEKGNFQHERRDQFKRFWGHVLNTIQSNLKFGKFLLQK